MRIKFILIALLAFMTVVPEMAWAQQKKTTRKKNIAVQLYSVRDLLKGTQTKEQYDNYMKVLKNLSQMGYTAVEAANYNDGKFYGRTPEEFKKDVESAGMKVLSSHCGKQLTAEELASGNPDESLKWWDQCIAAHKAA